MIKSPPNRLCPDHQEMYRFVMGDLDEPSSQILSSHLEQCPQCNDIIAMEDEVLLAWLRRGLKTPLPADDPDILNAIQIAKQAGTKRATDSPSAPPLPSMPAEIRDYQILEQIGAGGMGIVYRALHRRLKREVVLKVLNQRMSDDPSAVMRFEREMEAIGRLNHAHIVAAHDAGEVEGTHYLVMEYVDGITVSQLSRKLKQLSLTDACEIARQTAEALEFAHQQSLIHRDIKPSNLMISKAGIVKVLDLGLARLLKQESPDSELTNAGQIMGTVEYMAPEQAESLTDVDFRADIYSLGVTLYKLLAGASPYRFDEQDPAWKRLQKITTQTPVPLEEFRAELPPPLIQLVSDMLQREPAKRPASMAEVADRLQPFCAEANLAQLLSVDADQYAEQHDSSRTILESSLKGTRFSPDPNQNRETRPVAASVNGQGGNRRKPLLAALGGLGLVALLSVIIFLQSPSGAVEIRLADGVADDIQVNVLQKGRVIKVADQKSGWKIELKSGEYQLQLNGSDDEVQLDKHQVRILRGQSEVVSITHKPDTALAKQDTNQSPALKTKQPATTTEFQWPKKTKPTKQMGVLTASATFPEIPDWQIPFQDPFTQARFSPNGKYYLSSDSSYNTSPLITLTQVSTGEAIRSHQSRKFHKWNADSWYSWAPDSSAYCFSTSTGLTIVFIDPLRASIEIPVDAAREGFITGVSWRPDGKMIAVAMFHENLRSQIRLYHPDGSPGETLANQKYTRSDKNQRIHWELIWSPDSRYLLACNHDKSGVLHIDTTTRQVTPWLEENPLEIHQAAWSPDGKTIAFSGSKQILITSPQGKILQRHSFPDLYAQDLLWSADSKQLLVLSQTNYLIPSSGKPVSFHQNEINHNAKLIAAWPDQSGQRFLALDSLLGLQWYDLTTGEAQAVVEPRSANVPVWAHWGDLPIQNLVWNRQGTQLATFSRYNTSSQRSFIQVWNADGTNAHTITIPGQAARVAFDPRGDKLTATTTDGRLYQWSGQQNQPVTPILTQYHYIVPFARPEISFSYDGRYIACGAGVIDRKTNQIIWDYQSEKKNRYGFIPAWSPVENVLAVVSGTDSIISLHHPDGSRIAMSKPQKSTNGRPDVLIVRWSPDGQWIAVPQNRPDSVTFYSQNLKRNHQILKAGAGNFHDSHNSFWNWSADSQHLMGLATNGSKSDRALVVFTPDKQQIQDKQFQLPGYTTALLSTSPAGNHILLVKDQSTLCIHKLTNDNGPEIGPLLWQGEMFANGSSASFTPSGELISESNNGSQNLRCLIEEQNGQQTPLRYTEFQQRIALPAEQAALMSVLSRGGRIRSIESGELIAITANIEGQTRIASLHQPTLVDLTSDQANLKGLSILKNVKAGTHVGFSGNHHCTDRIFKELQGANTIVSLNLANTSISVASLPTLQSMPALKAINLSGTGIRDETIAGLATLPALESLNISNTLISDRCIDALLQMKHLKSLNLTGCQLSETQIKRIQTERPDCELIR